MLLGVCVWSACSTDNDFTEKTSPEQGNNKGELIELTAEADGNRTALADGNKVIFQSTDKISVFDGSNHCFPLVEMSDDSKSAKFKGEADATKNLFVLYPYQEGASMTGDVITATLPNTQTVCANNFDPAANLSVAVVNENHTFTLKNVVTLVKFNVPQGETYTKAELKSNDGMAVAGQISVNPSTLSFVSAEGAPSSITMTGTIAGGDAAGGTNYYIAVLPQVYPKGFTLTLTGADKKLSMKGTTESATLTRAKIMNMGTMNDHEYNSRPFVDLGLTEVIEGKTYDLYFAAYNVGANAVNQAGDWFAWGALEPYYTSITLTNPWGNPVASGNFKYSYNAEDYFAKNVSGVGNLFKNAGDILTPEHDVAHVKWGGDWRYPSRNEFQVLLDGVPTKDRKFESIPSEGLTKGLPTMVFTKNDVSLYMTMFLFLTGQETGGSGSGYYWANEAIQALTSDGSAKSAYRLYLRKDYTIVDAPGYVYKYFGYFVRPVFTREHEE